VKLEYTWSAVEDLKNIHKYISLDSSAAASRYVRLLKDRIKILKSHPEIGKPIHTQRFEHLRQLLYQSYRIIYEFRDNKVIIIAIQHQSRLPGNLPSLEDIKI